MFDEWRATAPEMEGGEEQSVSVPGRPPEFSGADVVDYRTTIEDPRAGDDEIVVLELHGLYANASVEVPGSRLVGEGPVAHETYFRPLRIPFDPDTSDQLRVRCRKPGDRFGGIHDTDLVPEDQSVPGIWWGANLEGRPLPYIESIDVRPRVEDGGAHLDLKTTVVSDGPLDDRITYSLRPAGDHKSRGMMDRGSVETGEAGRVVFDHTVDVHDPSLWWPRAMGDQNRYSLHAKLADDELSVTTGICDVRRDGSRLLVNGEQLYVRGVNLLTDAPADVDRAIECNANLLRAHAHALPPEVYQRCNEEGMLVWQDLPLTGPGEFDIGRGEALTAALGNQYGRHPSLAAVGIHDDPIDVSGSGLGSGFLDRLRLRWRAWRASYDAEPAGTVAAALPVDVPTFPVVGGPGVDAAAGSYYPGWEYGTRADMETLLARYPVHVVAEFGAGALGDTRRGDTAAGFDAAIHDRRVAGGVEDSQSHQAELLTEIVGSLRRERVGSIAFALRDTAKAGMGVFTHGGTPKTAASALADAYEPIRAYVADPDAAESDVIVLNDRPEGLSARVHYAAGSAEGTLDVTVSGQGRWRGGPISLPAGAESVSLTVDTRNAALTYEYDL